MIQIALILVSIGLIGLGIKGFTPSGLEFSKTTTLTGTRAKVVGALCILAGCALIPIVISVFWASSRR